MATNFDRRLDADLLMRDLEKDVEPFEVEVEDEDQSSITMIEGPDGSITAIMGEEEGDGDIPFGANLAEHLEDIDLASISADLISAYDEDLSSRAEWEKTLADGLDLLGLKIESRSTPWVGASGVYHPVLTEAAIRFQAQAMGELFPPTGPAKGHVPGFATTDTLKQAKRVADEVNFQLTEAMPEYRSEMEFLLFRLPLAGCAFKKIYIDPTLNRPTAVFVPAEDLVIPYGASDLRSAGRFAHRMRKTPNELKRLQVAGFYRDISVPEPSFTNTSKLSEKEQKLLGHTVSYSKDNRHTLLEFHTAIEVPGFDEDVGFALPYVVTIEKDSGKVLSIYRNWNEGDDKYIPREHFVMYQYLPGLGVYGIGMIHLIGGLAKASTSILRQLIDAGTLSNLPIGFKARGLRIKANDAPLRPGEFRDVDVPASAIRDGLYQIQVKEPSGVLFSLLQNVVDEARRIASVADLKISDVQQGAPVGTTLALMERSLKVMSGVQARAHASLKQELRIISGLIGTLDGNYSYDTGGEHVRADDFSSKVDVIPVSDPTASTMAQRVVQAQAVLELSQRAPDVYDTPKLHKRLLLAMGVREADEYVKMPDEQLPLDPVSENMAVLTGKPVKAFLSQDHEAHIKVHMAMAQDPKILALVGQSPNASAIQSAMAAHLAEHVAFAYRSQIEQMMGVQLPPPGEPLPEDIEAQIARLSAQAGTKLLEANQAEAAQQKAQEEAQDPLVQIEREKLANEKADLARKVRKDMMDATLKREKMVADASLDTVRIAVDAAAAEGTLRGASARDIVKAGVDLTKETMRAARGKGKSE